MLTIITRSTLLLAVLALPSACGLLEENRAPTHSAARATSVASTAPAINSNSAANAVSPSGYEIGPEDLLEINVWKEEGLKKEVLVRPDGGISFPLIGDLRAGGKTPQQLQKEIAQRLAQFIPRASVSVAVLKSASYKIYVVGRVNKPGEFTVGRRVDVLQALSMAGGLTPFAAAEEIAVLRKVNGKDARYRFNYTEVQRGIDLEQNIPLKSGDTVIVP